MEFKFLAGRNLPERRRADEIALDEERRFARQQHQLAGIFDRRPPEGGFSQLGCGYMVEPGIKPGDRNRYLVRLTIGRERGFLRQAERHRRAYTFDARGDGLQLDRLGFLDCAQGHRRGGRLGRKSIGPHDFCLRSTVPSRLRLIHAQIPRVQLG